MLLTFSVGGPAISSAGAAVPPVDALVRIQPGTETGVALAIRGLGGDPHQPLKVLNGYMARLPGDQLAAVQAIPGVISVATGVDIGFDPAMYDPEKVSSSMYQVAKNIGADRMWKDGYTGAGVDVAVIDSGVAPLPQFDGRVVNGPDLSFGSGDAARRRRPVRARHAHGRHHRRPRPVGRARSEARSNRAEAQLRRHRARRAHRQHEGRRTRRRGRRLAGDRRASTGSSSTATPTG